jgi:Holliday junction resolvase RusA-like endonuclease
MSVTVVPDALVSLIPPIVVVLPECPSANRYWRRHGHTIYRTREAKAYVELVAGLTGMYRMDGGPAYPDEDVSIAVIWHRSAKRGDLPNRTKILYDALQGTIYADDNQIAEEHTQRVDTHPTIPKGHVRVEVSAL